MKDRFRPPMIQSGLFAPNTFGRCHFLHLRTILQQCLLPEVTFIQTFDVFLWVGVSWTPLYGMKTESIPEPKVRSRNQSFLVKRNRNRNRFHMATLCWNRNRNQLQFFSERNRNRFRSAGIKHKSGGQPTITYDRFCHHMISYSCSQSPSDAPIPIDLLIRPVSASQLASGEADLSSLSSQPRLLNRTHTDIDTKHASDESPGDSGVTGTLRAVPPLLCTGSTVDTDPPVTVQSRPPPPPEPAPDDAVWVPPSATSGLTSSVTLLGVSGAALIPADGSGSLSADWRPFLSYILTYLYYTSLYSGSSCCFSPCPVDHSPPVRLVLPLVTTLLSAAPSFSVLVRPHRLQFSIRRLLLNSAFP